MLQIIAPYYDKLLNLVQQCQMNNFLKEIEDLNNKKVLDMGGGTGKMAYKFNEKDANSYLLDKSPKMTKQAANRLAEGKNVVADASSLPCKNNTFNTDATAQGTETLGKELNVELIPTIKGQAMSAYDPRNLKGIGVTYVVTKMGADHICGVTIMPGLDHMSKAGQVPLSSRLC